MRTSPWSSLIVFSVLACSGVTIEVPDGTGGQGSGGAASGGAAVGMGGSMSGGARSGGAGSGGNPSSGGASGGSSSGGAGDDTGGNMSGGAGPSGGADASGGAEASGGQGSGGGGGGKPPAEPSMGCGKANPQLGSAGSPLTVSGHQYYVKLPTNYDASKAYPTLFMFNPTGNPIDWAEKNAGYERNEAKDEAIRVYPHPANSSSGWGAGDVSFFAPLYDKVTADYCVDKARVFAAGESSGGDFSSILGCEHADKLRAIAPCATKNVNQYPLDGSRRTCTGQVAAIIIHGKNDNVVGPENGPKTRDFYGDLNNCDMSATPMPVQGYTDSQSNCVLYQGCDDGFPLYWCQHTDPEYSNTNHGWPKFAANMTWATFSSY